MCYNSVSFLQEKDEQVSKKVKADASPTDKSASEGSTSGGKKFSLKIISWNVNGIRAWAKVSAYYTSLDVFCSYGASSLLGILHYMCSVVTWTIIIVRVTNQ